MTRWPHWRTMLAASLACAYACAHSVSATSDAVTASPTPSTTCIGRFALDVPPGWIVSGRAQKMYLTELDDDTAVPATNSVDPVLDRLRQDLTPLTPMIRRFDLDGVGPAAWFGFGTIDSVDRRLVALYGAPARQLRLLTLATRGREPIAEKALGMIAPGYRPGARTGFCLAHGAMQLDPSRHEQVQLTVDATRWPDTTFVMDTRAVDQPDTSHPMNDPEAELRDASDAGLHIRLERQTRRAVAGLVGKEFRGVLTQDAAPPTRLYRFFFPGVGRQPGAPRIALQLDGPASEKQALDTSWNALLDSMRTVALKE